MRFDQVDVKTNTTSFVSSKLMVSAVKPKKSSERILIVRNTLFFWNIKNQIEHNHKKVNAKHHEYSVSESNSSFKLEFYLSLFPEKVEDSLSYILYYEP
jgi:hypothetical protein